jgi:hypothetical protein
MACGVWDMCLSGVVSGTFCLCFLFCRFGRKFLLIQGGIQLLICEVVVGILIAVGLGVSGERSGSYRCYAGVPYVTA